ncbi:MAG: FAD-dependent oxidoreductase [Bacteroidetes bacterium]|nr:FAD-dependent oxidoreductase [Bacteroidota bacterium]
MKKYEWAVIGSGIAGIIASEILTREGHEVILIEKNETLASETTRDFHEWMHAGSLFTLIPDNLKTLKFMLGALDDLLEFYSSYKRMNLIPTIKGIKIDTETKGWFNSEYIHFKFRIQGRKVTFPWIIGIARSILLINKIKNHDWLRRRAGVLDPFRYRLPDIMKEVLQLLKSKEKFRDIGTPDFTMNSRILIKDLISSSIEKGLTISTSNKFLNYTKKDKGYLVTCERESFESENIVLCTGANVSEVLTARVKNSYAPMAVVDHISDQINSFVELDYYPKNCINIIKKDNGIGLVGGISFNDINKCEPYIEEVIKKHQIYDPNIRKLYSYIGKKSEVIIEGEPRNYLFHIKEVEKGVWVIIPGKFTLGFSIGPEFYRKVYGKNPKNHFNTATDNGQYDELISNTVWFDVTNDKKKV